VSSSIDQASLLPSLPDGLRDPLFNCFNEIVRNFRERRWEPSELNGGKLCEVVYTIISGHIDGTFPNAPSKPDNMVDACRSLEQTPRALGRSVRIQIPRMLMALYEIRNNRGVGHTGGDVDPNHMDAVAVLYMSKWLMAEIVRIFHNVDTHTATVTVEALIEKILPIIWEVNGKHRVLNPNLTLREKTLVILYQIQDAVTDSELIKWIEPSNPSAYRKILREVHSERLIEYDQEHGTVVISPTGIHYVQESINLEL